MKHKLLILLTVSIACLIFCWTAMAQGSIKAPKQFEKDGLKFFYPSDWELKDKSSKEVVHLLLSKKNTSNLIVIFSSSGAEITKKGLTQVQDNNFIKLVDTIEKSLSEANKTARQEYSCFKLRETNIPGIKFEGMYKGQVGLGELYDFSIKKYPLTLAYLRNKSDDAEGNIVWSSLINSISFKNSQEITSEKVFDEEIADRAILNGKALLLPKPPYPKEARDNNADGKLKVAVTVDEKGDVISAEVISGHPLLKDAVLLSARNAKFKPLFNCSKAIKFKGLLVYVFEQ